MLREGMFIAERYEVIERIGSGGMSEVYKALDHKLNRYVAMKVLKSEFSEDKTFVSKFRAEAQSAAGLMHANIVNVYDVGEEEGLHYIVMELVEGITLKKYIERKGRLAVREAVSIAIQIAQGIEAAHKHHIVHRDIKPQNIIISKEGKVKVTDFGIARAASSNTINSAVMGSVHYISPEQARGGYSDEKSDIYSFGVTLFEMLTGKVPFEGDSTVAIALMHIQDDMVSPKALVPEIPISVEKIVLKCTQKKTERRYSNMSDLIADLKRSLVTPDEDFVVISTILPSDGPTRMLGEDEMLEISQRCAVKTTSADPINGDTADLGKGINLPGEEPDVDSDWDEDEDDDDDSEPVTKSKSRSADDFDDDEEDLGAPRKIDKIITIVGIVVAVAILVVTVIFISKMVGSMGSGEKTTTVERTTEETESGVVVPNLAGMTYEEAQEALNAIGLGIAKPVYAYGKAEDTNKVIAQDPEYGERVAEHEQITVTICQGEETVSVENVAGKSESEAKAILEEQGLVVKVEEQLTDNEDLVGKVYTTDPKAGTAIETGETITIYVYKLDTENVVVPDIKDMKESEARKTLQDLGLKIPDEDENGNENPVHKYSETVKAGYVISFSGADVGDKVPKGTEIYYVISDGPEPEETEAPATIPNVVGKTEADAKTAITNAGLTVGTITYEKSDSVAEGNVISQSGGDIGASVARGTAISFVVSSGSTTYTLDATIDSYNITGSLSDTWDKTQTIKIVYVVRYTNGSGAETTVQISSVTYDNANAMYAAFPLELKDEFKAATGGKDATAGDCTVEIKVTYYQTVTAEDGTTSTVEATATNSVASKIVAE